MLSSSKALMRAVGQGTREEKVEQRLLESASGRMPAVPSEAVIGGEGDEEEDELNPRVTASVLRLALPALPPRPCSRQTPLRVLRAR